MGLSVNRRCSMAMLATLMVLAGVLVSAVGNVEAAPLRGSPPITRFVTDLDVYPQNFCVEQDSRHIIYVCNADGVLEFDGERWKQWRLPNREMVRSLAVSEDDTVYVGGYNTFGYLRREATGQATFEDISARFKVELAGREFADVWQTVVTAEGIYFRALRDVFFWNPKTNVTAHWHHPGRLGALFSHGAKTYLQFRGEGFKVRDGNDWKLLPSLAHLKTPIFQVTPLADGTILAYGSTAGWLKFDGQNMTPQAMPKLMPANVSLIKMITLADGSVAVSTSNGRMVLIDSALQTMRLIDIESGFLSGLTQSRNGGIFASSDRALYKIEWPPVWSMVSVESQNVGSLHQVREWKSKRYALSSSGIYQLSESDGGSAIFAATPWPEAYDLIGLDDARALIAGAHHVVLTQNNQAKQISSEPIYPRKFQRSRFHEGRILLGTENGLATIDARKSNITVSEVVPHDVPIRIADIIEVSATEIWAGTSRHGVWRYTVSASGEIVGAKRMTDADGLLTGRLAEATITSLDDGGILAGTRAGFFKWDGKRFQPDEMNGLAKLRGTEEALSIVNVPDGTRWAYSATRVWHENPRSVWRQVDVRSLRRGAMINHFFMTDLASGEMHKNHIGFVNTHALLLHQKTNFLAPAPTATLALTSMQLKTVSPRSPQVQLRSVTLGFADGRTEHVSLTNNAIRQFPADDFNIRFEFALPEFMTDGARRYQAQLIGHDPTMSEWAVMREFSYSTLTPGRYTLLLRAKDFSGVESEIAPFIFEVAPRWYARLWARALALLFFLGLTWMLIYIYAKHRTERLAKQNLRLEKSVAERTKELADANRRLDMMAHIDGLTGIPNRRRLDEYLPVVWQLCQAQSKPISILIIDVDNFKQYNDTRGHLAGDELLRSLVARLLPCLRRTEDLLARYGGEEFMVILPGADGVVAALTAENMRASIEASTIGVTISVGISVTSLSATSGSDQVIAEQIRKADEALYMAKKLGRNRVQMST